MVAGSSTLLLGITAVLLSSTASAHVALWHNAMYGFCDGGGGASNMCTDTSHPVIPLQQQDFGPGKGGAGWWFHGAMDQPPAANTFATLPAGGVFTAELNCNKAGTSWQIGDKAKDQVNVCGSNTNVHTSDTWANGPTDATKGCAIAIAWKSDPATIVPADLIVVSTNRTCPFYAKTDFHMPADLPACPSGGCHAFWLWIHEAGDYGGYSKQMYMTPFKAKITGYSTKTKYPTPRVARKCVGAPAWCIKGAKNPHYWMQNEQNNALNPDFDPPYYNTDYGWTNGAQTDLRYKANPTAEIAWKKNWAYTGCYYDNNKMFGDPHTQSWQNEPDFCMAQCDAAGFKYAGVEYGYECRCSNGPIQGEKIAESSCNVPCSANSAKMCGAGGIMNIYSKGGAASSPAAAVAKSSTASTAVAPKSSTAAAVAKTTTAAAAKAAAATTSTKTTAATTAKLATTTAKVTSTAKVVARGLDEDGNDAEEELDEGLDNTVYVHELETVYNYLTITETVTETVTAGDAAPTLDKRDIPFLHKAQHHNNLNHHVGVHF